MYVRIVTSKKLWSLPPMGKGHEEGTYNFHLNIFGNMVHNLISFNKE